MKNILFIGPYRQADGWGEAAKQYVKALIASGNNLSIRPVYMAESAGPIPIEFLEYEENQFANYDIVIQNVLPHLLDYDSRFGKNVCLFYTETMGWHNNWPKKLNMMDEVWVPSHRDMLNVRYSGVEKNIRTLGIPVDTDKFLASYDSKELALLKDRDSFKFYFIGEFIQRKGLDKLVQAFHIAFQKGEKVDLIIKTSRGGLNPNQLGNILNEYCNKIKKNLRLYGNLNKYKKEMFITNRLSDEDMMALHNYCDCFVMPSSGESWSLPVLDALGFGKTPIVVDGTGPTDIVNNENGWVVPSRKEYVIVSDPPLADIYTANELWSSITTLDLCDVMQKAYNDRDSTNKIECGMQDVFQFSVDNIAKKINEYTS